MSDVQIEIGVETHGFRRAGRELQGLQRSIGGAATAVKGFVGIQVAKELASMASAAADFAKAGDEARRVASAFTGDLNKLKAASFGAVDDTTLQKLDQLTKEAERATGITQDLSDVLLVASERFSRGLGSSVAENATAIVKGEAEAMKMLAINIDMTDSRLAGLDESRKKAMITSIAASEATSINAANIDKEAFALAGSTAAMDNLVSELQTMTAEFLVNSGVLDMVSAAVEGLTGWFAENRDVVLEIGQRALGIMTRGWETLGPVLEVVADTVLILADGFTTLVAAGQEAIDFLNPFSTGIEDVDFKAIAADASVDTLEGGIRDMGNAAATSAAQVRGLVAAQSALAEAGADPLQVLNDFDKLTAKLGSRDLALDDVELSGQTPLLLGAAAARRDQMQARAAQLDQLADRARSVAAGGEDSGNLQALARVNAELEAAGFNSKLTADQLRLMALDAQDAAQKWDSVVGDIADGFSADDPGGVGGAAKAATKEVWTLTSALDALHSTIAGAEGWGSPFDDLTAQVGAGAMRAARALGANPELDALTDIGSVIESKLAPGIELVAQQFGDSDGWQTRGAMALIWGNSEPETELEMLARLTGELEGLGASWGNLTKGFDSVGIDAISGTLAMFSSFTSQAGEIEKASKAIGGGFDKTTSALGTLASTGIGAMGAFTSAVIDDQKVQAGIMSAFEAAQALASFPDPIGMATHGAASALFASVAAGAFDTAGGSGGARGAASAGAAFGAPTLADSFSRDDSGGTKESTVIQLMMDSRQVGEAVIEGANDLTSNYRRPARLSQRAVGGGERRLWG